MALTPVRIKAIKVNLKKNSHVFGIQLQQLPSALRINNKYETIVLNLCIIFIKQLAINPLNSDIFLRFNKVKLSILKLF